MKTLLSCAILCLFYQVSKAQSGTNALPTDFKKKLDEAKMIFIKPEGLSEIPVVKTDKVSYDFMR